MRIDKTGKPALVTPGPGGGHNWQPMAFDARRGLVYIPAMLTAFPYIPEAGFEANPQGFNTGMDFAAAAMPAVAEVRDEIRAATTGALIAWDPVAQEQRWEVAFKGPWNGGVLATGGGLVFQGHAPQEFAAFDAGSGDKLWSTQVQTGIVAAPVTYAIDGEQYIAVVAGWGGVYALITGALAEVAGPVKNVSRLLVYKLGGTASLPAATPIVRLPLEPPEVSGTAEQHAEGAKQYARVCSGCHGDAAYGSTVIPDLRRSAMLSSAESWASVAHEGILKDRGMVGFAPTLTAQQVESIRLYVIKRANEDKELGEQ
jgi:alcohol dehydrogenase (cytochrome c)/quinohemoprotein ethanol dehydrogenase